MRGEYVGLCFCVCVYLCIFYGGPDVLNLWVLNYEVAMISRLPKNIGLFCKRALYKRLYSAKETYIFEEPTNNSHSISHERSL